MPLASYRNAAKSLSSAPTTTILPSDCNSTANPPFKSLFGLTPRSRTNPSPSPNVVSRLPFGVVPCQEAIGGVGAKLTFGDRLADHHDLPIGLHSHVARSIGVGDLSVKYPVPPPKVVSRLPSALYRRTAKSVSPRAKDVKSYDATATILPSGCSHEGLDLIRVRHLRRRYVGRHQPVSTECSIEAAVGVVARQRRMFRFVEEIKWSSHRPAGSYHRAE